MRASSSRVIDKSAYLLPNLMTTFNLICGLAAIILSLETLTTRSAGNVRPHLYVASAWLILAAMVFDFLDGKVARWVHAVSDFGVKIDSLTDFVSFGIAPMVLAYAVLLHPLPLPVLAPACGLFLLAGAWRLARFNCESASGAGYQFFTGLPIPAAASFLCSIVLIFPGNEQVTTRFLGRSFSSFPPTVTGLLTLTTLIILAFLMVSRIPFPAFKKIDRQNLILLSGVGIFFAVLLIILPLQFIVFLIMLLYLFFGLFHYFVDRVLRLQYRRTEGGSKRTSHPARRKIREIVSSRTGSFRRNG